MDDDILLGGLFVTSLLAATLLPGGSEIALAAVISREPDLYWPSLGVASLGNTLGGMSSYALGRFLPQRPLTAHARNQIDRLRRFGAPVLVLSWLPVVGDALCIAAGWLRLDAWRCTLFMLLGKFIRYWILATALV